MDAEQHSTSETEKGIPTHGAALQACIRVRRFAAVCVPRLLVVKVPPTPDFTEKMMILPRVLGVGDVVGSISPLGCIRTYVRR